MRLPTALDFSCLFPQEVVMPQYDYFCLDCQQTFSQVLTLIEHDKERIACPKCGSKKVEQRPSAFYAVTSKKSA